MEETSEEDLLPGCHMFLYISSFIQRWCTTWWPFLLEKAASRHQENRLYRMNMKAAKEANSYKHQEAHLEQKSGMNQHKTWTHVQSDKKSTTSYINNKHGWVMSHT